MNVTAIKSYKTYSLPSNAQTPGQAPAPSEPTTPVDGWRSSTPVQSGIWTAAMLGSAALGAVAGPKYGMLGGAAIGAVAGFATCRQDRGIGAKLGAAFLGAGFAHAAGIIGSASMIGGGAISAVAGVGTGWAMAKANTLPESQI